MPIPDASALSGLRVLIVDDDLDCCVWIACAFELYGIEVHSSFTVSQGLEAFDQLCPDLVLSDIAMPNEDGYSLLRQIRQRSNRLNKSTPVVALTALPEPEDRCIKSEVWFDRWFLKPIDINELLRAITQLTGHSILV